MRSFLSVLLAALWTSLPSQAADVTLRQEDLTQVAADLWIAQGLNLPAPDPTLPLVGERVPKGAATLLHRAGASGGINGFAGILYDNRDRDHSALPAVSYPRLARLLYGPDLKETDADYGLAGAFLFPAVVFGNSSTAVTGGPFARSLPRLAMTNGNRPERTAVLYLNNHLYAYPEHRDYDAVDLFPANWPYTIISQGSSGSDRAFLQAMAGTLAAFPKETFAAMRQARLVAPTLQMLLRRNMGPIRSREAYFTGTAHPTAFNGKEVSAGRMISQATSMQPEDIPPFVHLTVEEETFRAEAGLAGRSERLFDTPAAIARIWRGFDGTQEMVVRTAETADPFDRPLTFRWVLLRGDPEKVRIEPLDAAGTRARIRLDWHDPYPERGLIEGEPGARQISRIDIAVFAEAGDVVSAPSFLSVSFPAHQRRTYGRGAGGPVLLEVDYDAIARQAPYDPALHWSAPWTDKARTDSDGVLLGWTRQFSDGRTERIALDDGTYRIDATNSRQPVLRREDAPAE